MHNPIYSSAEHKSIVTVYFKMCKDFVEGTTSKNKYQNYLDVVSLIVNYHNGYGEGVKENNFYDWITILPINLSIATFGFFAGIENKKNAASIRAYRVILEQALEDTINKLDQLEPANE